MERNKGGHPHMKEIEGGLFPHFIQTFSVELNQASDGLLKVFLLFFGDASVTVAGSFMSKLEAHTAFKPGVVALVRSLRWGGLGLLEKPVYHLAGFLTAKLVEVHVCLDVLVLHQPLYVTDLFCGCHIVHLGQPFLLRVVSTEKTSLKGDLMLFDPNIEYEEWFIDERRNRCRFAYELGRIDRQLANGKISQKDHARKKAELESSLKLTKKQMIEFRKIVKRLSKEEKELIESALSWAVPCSYRLGYFTKKEIDTIEKLERGWP
jgi:hypothetical protein